MSLPSEASPAVVALTKHMALLRKQRAYAEARAAGVAGLAMVRTARDGELVAIARALATYKDPEYPVLRGLSEAATLLEPYLPSTRDPETFAGAGAIEKRRYEVDLQLEHLEASYMLYERGHQLDKQLGWPSQGYPGINAAYLLEVFEKLQPRNAESLSQQRIALWRELVDVPPPPVDDREKHYFHRVTVADALLGLDRYDEALAKYKEARALQPDGWQLETSARHLAASLRMRSPDGRIDARGRRVIEALVGGDADAVASAIRGKLGLGLSGGGFRASLFHIGVLAWLAECDLLRHVEVISCVSGGSLLGAAYQLELRKLYADKLDHEITPQDFADLVARIAESFPRAVRRNLRTRVLFDRATNVAILSRETSRTATIAELYETHLYAHVGSDGEHRSARYVDQLLVEPRGEPAFRRDYDNWRRRARVPTIIFNAASLNTGHSFYFTPTEMGEPPLRGDEDVDVNDRFERQGYDAFPEPWKRVRLGQAVGASAAVPVLFEPLELRGAYGENLLRLVDGGLCDNQGAGALLEQGCNSLVVSDASGQMSLESAPSGSELGVGGRSSQVLQARLRDVLYQDLRSRERGNLLRGLAFIHLKQGIAPRSISPRAASVVSEASPDLAYGVSRAVQERLAALRTDLDAFSELEAELLMASGYKMAKHYIDPARYAAEPLSAPPAPPSFLRVEPLLRSRSSGTATEREVLRLLDVGQSLVVKAFLVDEQLGRSVKLAGAVAGAIILALLFYFRSAVFFSVTAGSVALFIITKVIVSRLPQAAAWFDVIHARDTLVSKLLVQALAALVASVARLSVKHADPIFLQAGAVAPLLAARAAAEAETPG